MIYIVANIANNIIDKNAIIAAMLAGIVSITTVWVQKTRDSKRDLIEANVASRKQWSEEFNTVYALLNEQLKEVRDELRQTRSELKEAREEIEALRAELREWERGHRAPPGYHLVSTEEIQNLRGDAGES